MKAIIYEKFGSPEVLKVAELAQPIPGAGEVLVRVHAAALNPKDSLLRKGKFKALQGSQFPKLVGFDFAGTLETAADDLPVGTRVFGMKNGFQGATVAQFAVVKTTELAAMPKKLTFEEGAAIPLTALTSLQALRPALERVKAPSAVLIHGASGGVGVYAIQIAKLLGAHVTTTSSAGNMEFCRSLGADIALDYKATTALEYENKYDVIFDVFGNRTFSKARTALKSPGTYVTTVPSPQIAFDQVTTLMFAKKAHLVVVSPNREDLDFLAAAITKGSLKAVIDRVLPLEETAAGQALIETKRAKGKVVIRVD